MSEDLFNKPLARVHEYDDEYQLEYDQPHFIGTLIWIREAENSRDNIHEPVSELAQYGDRSWW
jgi:hypothetical protein